MASSTKTEQGRSLVVRWRMLAERQLAHLVNLYESGRWKVYYKEPEFLKAIQEARAALKAWEQLAPPDQVSDKPVEVAIAQAANSAVLASPFTDIPAAAASADRIQAEYQLRKA